MKSHLKILTLILVLCVFDPIVSTDINISPKTPKKRAASIDSRNNNRRVIGPHSKNKNYDVYVLYDYVDDSDEAAKFENDEEFQGNQPLLPPVLWSLRNKGGSNGETSNKKQSTTKKPTFRQSSNPYDSGENVAIIINGLNNNSSLASTLLKAVNSGRAKPIAPNSGSSSGKTTKNAIASSGDKANEIDDESTGDTCVTKECTLAAADMLRAMDIGVQPCDDFYKFACGGWLKNNPLEPPIESWSQFHVLEEKLRKEIREILEKEPQKDDPIPVKMAQTFYKSCQKKEPLKDLPTHLQKLTNQYLSDFDGDNIKNATTFAQTLGALRREFGGDYIISLFIGLDDKNTSKHAIYLDSPTLALDRVYHVDLGSENQNYIAQIESIEEYWPKVYPDVKKTDVSKIAREILDFETHIAEISAAPENLRNETELYNPYKMRDFIKEFGESDSVINYKDYLEEVFKEVKEKDKFDLGDLDDLEVIIREKDFFRNLDSVLNNAIEDHPHVIGNYLRWRIILDYGIVQQRKLQEIGFSKLVTIKKSNNLKSSDEDRNKFCSDLTNSYFGMAITYRSVKEGFTAESYEQVKEMASNIIDGFFNIINTSEWIATEETKTKAKEKSRRMKPFIGHPDWLLNTTALENHYKGVDLTKPDDHFQNYFEMSKWDIRNNLKVVNSPGNTERWVRDPMVINAFYHSQGNSFYFPAGILQPPMYYTGKQVQALNYGAIGMVMGHEITHGFDDTGKQRDEFGNLNDWWDDATLQNYIKRAQCFSKQYSKYEVEELRTDKKQIFLNGNLTLDENIADNGGLREAFEGYKTYVKNNGPEKKLPGMDYSPEQIFFLSFAQAWCGSATRDEYLADVEVEEHSPYPFRVKGVLDNSPEFAEAWGCPAPNPQSCRLW